MTDLAKTLADLAAKATPGEWKIHSGMLGHKGDLFSPTAKQVQDCHHIARFYAPKPDRKPLSDLEAIGEARDAVAQIEANAALVAYLVNNLPTIIAAQSRHDKVLAERDALGAENAQLREANGILEDALQEVGDDYPGSSCQEWCIQQIKAARAALEAKP